MFFYGFADELVKLGAPKGIVELIKKSDKILADKLESTIFGDDPGNLPKHSRYFGKFDNDGNLIGMTRVNTKPTLKWKKDTLYPVIKSMNPQIAISAIAVRPENRRKGIAKEMRAHLQKKFSSILTATDTEESNVPAMERLNEQMGFTQFADRKNRKFYFWDKSKK